MPRLSHLVSQWVLVFLKIGLNDELGGVVTVVSQVAGSAVELTFDATRTPPGSQGEASNGAERRLAALRSPWQSGPLSASRLRCETKD